MEEAAAIPGACVLRAPTSSRTGHIAISDGAGGTVEAHSTARGVVVERIAGRRWDTGVLVPGVAYFRSDSDVVLEPPPDVLRLTTPLMRGPRVRGVQRELRSRGYLPGRIDGIYGPQTASAARAFQHDAGLVPDGEVGPRTLAALGLGA